MQCVIEIGGIRVQYVWGAAQRIEEGTVVVTVPRHFRNRTVDSESTNALVQLAVGGAVNPDPRRLESGTNLARVMVALPLNHTAFSLRFSDCADWLPGELAKDLVERFFLDKLVWAGSYCTGGLSLLAGLTSHSRSVGALAYAPLPLFLCNEVTADENGWEAPDYDETWTDDCLSRVRKTGFHVRLGCNEERGLRTVVDEKAVQKHFGRLEAIRLYLRLVGLGWEPGATVDLHEKNLGDRDLDMWFGATTEELLHPVRQKY